jgi:hypothetical protein
MLESRLDQPLPLSAQRRSGANAPTRAELTERLCSAMLKGVEGIFEAGKVLD